MKYDTTKIRSIARELANCSNDVGRAVGDVIEPAGRRIADFMEGMTAAAAVEAFATTGRELNAIKDDIGDISKSLLAFAKRLEDADAKSRRIIGDR